MIDRTLISLAGGVVGGLVVLVAAWVIVSAAQVVSWQIPVASGIAVFVALWVVDFLTDLLAKRQR